MFVDSNKVASRIVTNASSIPLRASHPSASKRTSAEVRSERAKDSLFVKSAQQPSPPRSQAATIATIVASGFATCSTSSASSPSHRPKENVP